MTTRQKEQYVFSALGVAAAIGFSLVFLIALELYFTPLVLNACCGIGISPVAAIDMSGAENFSRLLITHMVPASQVRVGDVLLLHSQLQGVELSHEVVHVDELFMGIHFSTNVHTAGLSQGYSFVAGSTDQLPVLFATLPWGAELVSVAYSPQFQVVAVFLLVLVPLMLLLRSVSSRTHVPGEMDIDIE